jgi:hypothetical protein
MKIRQGFVSNSSSSSFCIYGVSEVSIEKIKEIAIKLGFNDKDCDDDFEYTEFLYNKTDFVFEGINENDNYYVGIPWRNIKNNETGAEFKKRVKTGLKKFGIASSKATTHEEAWYPC